MENIARERGKDGDQVHPERGALERLAQQAPQFAKSLP
jgi:hypothetical protein